MNSSFFYGLQFESQKRYITLLFLDDISSLETRAKVSERKSSRLILEALAFKKRAKRKGIT